MSLDITSEGLSYVHCNFCNTILAVNVPSSSMSTIVTVRCGHCANLLSVNIGALLHTHVPSHQDHQQLKQQQSSSCEDGDEGSSSNKCNMMMGNKLTTPFDLAADLEQVPLRIPPIRPPEKRQRVPSAYNRFIKEEIQRIKASNPEISHREAFSTAAKNWAHFPHIHFGLKLDETSK